MDGECFFWIDGAHSYGFNEGNCRGCVFVFILWFSKDW